VVVGCGRRPVAHLELDGRQRGRRQLVSVRPCGRVPSTVGGGRRRRRPAAAVAVFGGRAEVRDVVRGRGGGRWRHVGGATLAVVGRTAIRRGRPAAVGRGLVFFGFYAQRRRRHRDSVV